MTSVRLVSVLTLVTTGFGCASVLGFDEGHARSTGGATNQGSSMGGLGALGSTASGGAHSLGGTVSISGGFGGTLTPGSSTIHGTQAGGNSPTNSATSAPIGGAPATGGAGTRSSTLAVSSGGVAAATGGALATGGSRASSTGGAAAVTGGAPAGTGGAAIATGGALPATGGAAIATGGVAATGGVPSTGGKPPTGGAPATGGFVATGCTGSYEHFQAATGGDLCVAKMAAIPGPSADKNYSIDATEVTRGQYESWVARNPALPAASDPQCGWKSSGSYAPDATTCMTSSRVFSGTNYDHHPQVCVDWCDAYQYCAAIGKRLCGNINGGAIEYGNGNGDETVSQWYRACSSGGKNCFPYDGYNGALCDIHAAHNDSNGCDTCYDGSLCVDHDYWNPNPETTKPVGSMNHCQSLVTQYAGVYDLSGNAWEWEDSCKSNEDACMIRGGGFDGYGYNGDQSGTLYCWNHDSRGRRNSSDIIGFRCCSR